MRSEALTFFSEGEPISAIWRTPDDATTAVPAIVQGPGWLGLKDAKLYVPYHEGLSAAGFGVLIIDYRGFGDSGGDSTLISPMRQVRDLMNAVTYLQTRDDVMAEQIGTFGSGGTGGGNAVMLAALDPRVRCAVAQVPIADGHDWLRRMRDQDAWESFLARLENDRVRRVLTGEGAMVHPRNEIMVPSAERRRTTVKKDVDGRVPELVSLASAERIMSYRPIDLADRISPRAVMVVAVDQDTVTPTDHATDLFERAGIPKRLVVQYDTSHYAAYKEYGSAVIPLIIDWFMAHLTGRPLAPVHPADGVKVTDELGGAAG